MRHAPRAYNAACDCSVATSGGCRSFVDSFQTGSGQRGRRRRSAPQFPIVNFDGKRDKMDGICCNMCVFNNMLSGICGTSVKNPTCPGPVREPAISGNSRAPGRWPEGSPPEIRCIKLLNIITVGGVYLRGPYWYSERPGGGRGAHPGAQLRAQLRHGGPGGAERSAANANFGQAGLVQVSLDLLWMSTESTDRSHPRQIHSARLSRQQDRLSD